MTAVVATPLTVAESDHLEACEVVIERGIAVFTEVGTALMSVRDNRLYRAEFATFEDYCLQRWSLESAQAYRMIDAARVVELISSPMGEEINNGQDVAIPATERQARELAPLLDDPEELREVWNEAVERTNGKPTAAAIRDAREDREKAAAVPIVEWSDDERQLRAEVEAGRTVVASLRGEHRNLIAWADETGRYSRIDRRSEWGNPFELPDDGDRSTVIANYAKFYLPNKPSLLSKLGELRGRVLGCWCVPEACHGDVLIEAMDSLC